MSLEDSDYKITSICPAAPGWRSCWFEASSTATLALHTAQVAVWGVADYREDEYDFSVTVGICANGNSMEPIECGDGSGFLGYLEPNEDVEKYRETALRRIKRQQAKRAKDKARYG